MLLSRIFSLILGTTLFVVIWSMQDGQHGLRQRAAVHAFPQLQPSVTRPVNPPPASIEPAPVSAAQTSASDHALWMFADELPTQVAGK